MTELLRDDKFAHSQAATDRMKAKNQEKCIGSSKKTPHKTSGAKINPVIIRCLSTVSPLISFMR
tara:strand:- start:172 stop:363 length:192 start_codon:yes stop_codon:yes gene_type:complete